MSIKKNEVTLNDRQVAILNHIADHPGVSIAELHRAMESKGVRYGISGHRYFYAAITRLRRSGLVRGTSDGPRVRLSIQEVA